LLPHRALSRRQARGGFAQRFNNATDGKILRYVIGSMWLCANVAHYSWDQPKALIDGLLSRSPWIELEVWLSKSATPVSMVKLTHC
jgi:hypothetical protein